MKRLFIKSFAFSCLLLFVVLAGCSGSRPATTGGPQASAASPAAVSSSADVVKLRTDAVALPAGGNIDGKVVLSISSGFHINANPATFSYLIATELTTGKTEGITVGAPGYPAAVKKKFQFAEEPLAVYEGEVGVNLNLRAEKNTAAGPRLLPITVRVQACDEEKCYPPATLNSAIPVTVK